MREFKNIYEEDDIILSPKKFESDTNKQSLKEIEENRKKLSEDFSVDFEDLRRVKFII